MGVVLEPPSETLTRIYRSIHTALMTVQYPLGMEIRCSHVQISLSFYLRLTDVLMTVGVEPKPI
ncbi:MAG: hypothetical protein AAFQ57_06270, partial [Cyanobacteria bacterium J06626_14]